jgi:hypothetical protein
LSATSRYFTAGRRLTCTTLRQDICERFDSTPPALHHEPLIALLAA